MIDKKLEDLYNRSADPSALFHCEDVRYLFRMLRAAERRLNPDNEDKNNGRSGVGFFDEKAGADICRLHG